MEAAYYLRVLRTRWRALLAFALLGALAAFAFSMFESRNSDDEINYYVAKHKLVVSPTATEQSRFPNLQQTALLVTGGEVPEIVATTLDTDEPGLTKRIRTVTDLQVNVIEISAVGTDADDTALVATLFAEELMTHVNARDRAAYDLTLDEARQEVTALSTRIESVSQSITQTELDLERARIAEAAAAAALADAIAAGEEPPEAIVSDDVTVIELTEELRGLQLERDTRTGLFTTAIARLDSLERAGPPAPLLETLDVVNPFTISKKTYDERLRQGKRGDNNFSANDVDSGSGGGLNLGDTVSNPIVRIGLGTLGGLVVGLGVVLLHLRFDPRLRTKADIEEAFDLPVLAEVPEFPQRKGEVPELHALTRGRSMVTESYRMVRSALLFARATAGALTPAAPGSNGNGNGNANGNGNGPGNGDDDRDAGVPDIEVLHEMRVVMVTSPGPSEGKTTTTANLAVVLAEAGYEVLVVNCDYRLPKLHKYFDRDHEARRTIDTGIGGVTLIADVADSPSANPTEVVESQRNLIRKARDRYDVVLLDTAPILATNDAAGLLPVVDIVVLVAQEGKTDREAAAETTDLLRRRRANIAGVVVTGSSGFGRSRYYYKYRYGGYYDDDVTPKRGGKPAPTRAARALVSQN